jgi:quercetin dioxygenase-like cupin family protein
VNSGSNNIMSNQSQFKHLSSATGPVYWSPGDQIRFILTGEETGGAFFLGEVLVPPGGGPPPHIHEREDETYYLLEGTLTVRVGDRTLFAAPGDCVHLPRGIAHSFRNTGNQNAKFLVTATPAGIERFFEEAFSPVEEGKPRPIVTEALMGRMMTAAARSGCTILPPPRAH